jgi:hypothetical protein
MQDLDPELFSEAVAKGADLLKNGVTDFPTWSRAMVSSFGEPICPHLERIWTLAQEEWQRRRPDPPIVPPSDPPLPSSEKPVSRRQWAVPKSVAIGILMVIVGLFLASEWTWWHGRQTHTAQTPTWGETEPVQPDSLAALKARAEKGESAAQFSLGWCYFKGEGVPQDYGEAVKWYRKAAEQGNARAQCNLGWCYHAGRGVPKDYVESAKWFRKAAEHGDAYGQCNLGWCYHTGQGVPKDYAEADKWLRTAADQGNAGAQHNLGLCYKYGQGVPKDYAEAVQWFRKAAEQGIDHAQVELGRLYASGLGVPQDYAEAVRWYRKAADRGEALAQFFLGLCYEHGQGVPKDYAEAVQWYRKAADQGKAVAQYNLGVCYANGQGFPQNDIEAYKWFSLAVAHGLEDAPKVRAGGGNRRDSLSRRMARAEIIEAQRHAAAFAGRKESADSPDGFGVEPRPRFGNYAQKASGTAFFITEDGYLLSNYHVIQGATRISVKTGAGLLSASVVKSDPANDIALLKVSGSFRALPIASSREGKMGDSVFTVGFPNIGLQGTEANFTRGEISSPSGAQDDPRQFQISVAVQPGNSGGPLVNTVGNVVGIVTARLSEAAALESSGMPPQNVNYAIKISYALPLLESVPGLAGKLKPPHPARERKSEEVVQEAPAAALVLVY